MAKKTTNVVNTQETEIKETETVRAIIAKSETPLRKRPSLESKYIVGQMKIGVEYTIIEEIKGKIYGNFYLLNNGYYVTKSGNYLIDNYVIYK